MASRSAVEHLNHLGIVAEVCREIGVAAWLDQQDASNRHSVSVGLATVALALDGLRLSRASHALPALNTWLSLRRMRRCARIRVKVAARETPHRGSHTIHRCPAAARTTLPTLARRVPAVYPCGIKHHDSDGEEEAPTVHGHFTSPPHSILLGCLSPRDAASAHRVHPAARNGCRAA